jgi:hypothetical protein
MDLIPKKGREQNKTNTMLTKGLQEADEMMIFSALKPNGQHR